MDLGDPGGSRRILADPGGSRRILADPGSAFPSAAPPHDGDNGEGGPEILGRQLGTAGNSWEQLGTARLFTGRAKPRSEPWLDTDRD
ncbi:hypothetical protein DUI87_21803 [Hirundo rustica rustica]|uniref:Uncharacterized protein n=1 Tax=Hirundo rustica rustica TaxID=333673 RepID=A0A3M0JKY7_HIRRU|nr:hypothetical protein DUI87_21803 [Hirundo rustica rustica]